MWRAQAIYVPYTCDPCVGNPLRLAFFIWLPTMIPALALALSLTRARGEEGGMAGGAGQQKGDGAK